MMRIGIGLRARKGGHDFTVVADVWELGCGATRDSSERRDDAVARGVGHEGIGGRAPWRCTPKSAHKKMPRARERRQHYQTISLITYLIISMYLITLLLT